MTGVSAVIPNVMNVYSLKQLRENSPDVSVYDVPDVEVQEVIEMVSMGHSTVSYNFWLLRVVFTNTYSASVQQGQRELGLI
jgi:hypothetical protein